MTNDIDLLNQLIERARNQDYSKFHQLQNWGEYSYIKALRNSVQATVKAFNKCSKKVLNSYCKAVKDGSADTTKLVAYNTLVNTAKFYEKELGLLNLMIYEYKAYLLEGNYLNALCGAERALNDN